MKRYADMKRFADPCNPWEHVDSAHRAAMKRGSYELLAAICRSYPNIDRHVRAQGEGGHG